MTKVRKATEKKQLAQASLDSLLQEFKDKLIPEIAAIVEQKYIDCALPMVSRAVNLAERCSSDANAASQRIQAERAKLGQDSDAIKAKRVNLVNAISELPVPIGGDFVSKAAVLAIIAKHLV